MSLWQELIIKHDYFYLREKYEPDWKKCRNKKHHHRLFYIRIRKTGSTSLLRSTSIKNALATTKDLTWDAHWSFNDIQARHNFNIHKHAVVFAVVRNPFDWLVSFWARHRNEISFEDFIKHWTEGTISLSLRDKDQLLTSFLFSQLYATNDPQIKAHIILRFEHLQKGLDILATQMNIPALKLKKNINKSRHNHYKEHYTPETRQMIEKHCAEELFLFGYSFDGATDDSIFINPYHCRRLKV